MSEINEGVRFLVERMKTNPEEFYEGYESKWAYIVKRAEGAGWLTEEEHKLLNDAANQLQRERFTADVLKTLTAPEIAPYETRVAAKQMYVNQGQAKVINQLMVGSGGAGGSATLTTSGSPVVTQSDLDRAIAKLEGGKVFK